MIFLYARFGIADEAHTPGGKIGKTAEIIRDFEGFRVGIQRIDGEIAPRRIVFPFVGEGDRGAPAIGRDIAPQRGDLHISVVEDRGHGAVVDTGGNSADTGILAAIDDGGGQMPRRRVDIMRAIVQHRVAYAAADPANILSAQRFDELGQARALRPFGLWQMCRHQCASSHAIRRDRFQQMAAVTPQIR